MRATPAPTPTCAQAACSHTRTCTHTRISSGSMQPQRTMRPMGCSGKMSSGQTLVTSNGSKLNLHERGKGGERAMCVCVRDGADQGSCCARKSRRPFRTAPSPFSIAPSSPPLPVFFLFAPSIQPPTSSLPPRLSPSPLSFAQPVLHPPPHLGSLTCPRPAHPWSGCTASTPGSRRPQWPATGGRVDAEGCAGCWCRGGAGRSC